MLASEVSIHVFPGGHNVALRAVAAPASLLLSTGVWGRRKGGTASPPGLRLDVTPQVSYPSLGKVVPVLNQIYQETSVLGGVSHNFRELLC